MENEHGLQDQFMGTWLAFDIIDRREQEK